MTHVTADCIRCDDAGQIGVEINGLDGMKPCPGCEECGASATVKYSWDGGVAVYYCDRCES